MIPSAFLWQLSFYLLCSIVSLLKKTGDANSRIHLPSWYVCGWKSKALIVGLWWLMNVRWKTVPLLFELLASFYLHQMYTNWPGNVYETNPIIISGNMLFLMFSATNPMLSHDFHCWAINKVLNECTVQSPTCYLSSTSSILSKLSSAISIKPNLLWYSGCVPFWLGYALQFNLSNQVSYGQTFTAWFTTKRDLQILHRHLLWPKWDILLRNSGTSQ